MKTLMLETETKESRRQRYRVPQQDHATRGNAVSYNVDPFLREHKNARQKRLSQLAIAEGAAEIDTLSPQELDDLATLMINEAELKYLNNDVDTEDDQPTLAAAIETDPDHPYLETYDPRLEFEKEFNNALRAGRDRQRDAERQYQGTSDDDVTEYLDGFHIVDRP